MAAASATLDPSKSPISRKKIKVLYTIGVSEWQEFFTKRRTPNASTMYRALNPMVFLNASGRYECTMTDWFTSGKELDPKFKETDVVVFPRIMNVNEGPHKNILRQLRKAGKAIVFEHDDWYWDLGPSHYRKHDISDQSLANTLETARMADAITSPNMFLSEKTKEAAGSEGIPVMIPNGIMLSEWRSYIPQRKVTGQVRIMLSGGTNHFIDWIWILPVLRKLKRKYGQRIQFVFLGVNPEGEKNLRKILAQGGEERFVKGWKEMLEHYRILIPALKELGAEIYSPVDFLKYPAKMVRLSPDIGVVVTSGEIYDQCKSSLKFAEFTAAGAVTVCRKQKPYSDELSPAYTRFADSLDEYYKEICAMVDSPFLRAQIQQKALRLVEEKYDIRVTWKLWDDLFTRLVARKKLLS